MQGDGEPEVLVGGTAVTPPYPAWALTDLALVTVARPVRDFHEAVSAVDPGRRRRRDPFAGGLVSPHDPDLDDVVVRDGRAVALIDVDLAGPGSRVRDVACAAHVRLAVTDICRSRAFPSRGSACRWPSRCRPTRTTRSASVSASSTVELSVTAG